MPSTASMAREDILCVGARIWPAALFTRMSSGRFCQMRSIIASTASGRRTSHLTVSISAPVSLVSSCRLLQHVLAAATDHNVRAELEEAVAHRAAESRAATSHQNALAL